jgi:hypothetical protein
MKMIKKQAWFVLLALVANLVMVPSSFAALFEATLGLPEFVYINTSHSALTYNATSHLFSISAGTTAIILPPNGPAVIQPGGATIQIHAIVDNTGALVGSTPGGNDLVVSGTATCVVGNVTNTYSGVLLTGRVTRFGYLASGNTDPYEYEFLPAFTHGIFSWGSGRSDQYMFRFAPTGGALFSFFRCGEITVLVTSENSTFTGDFMADFNGGVCGYVGLDDIAPPSSEGLFEATLDLPEFVYINTSHSALTYNATSHLFSISAGTIAIILPPNGPAVIRPSGATIQIHAIVDNTGALGCSTGDNDLVISGTATRIVRNVTDTYSGVLLTGRVTRFGYLASGNTDPYEYEFLPAFTHGIFNWGPGRSDQYMFRFVPTGGTMYDFFNGGEITVLATSQNSTFTGGFMANFSGGICGYVGLNDLVPPQ